MSSSGQRLRERREKRPGRRDRPLSREALAGRLGVSTTTLQKWERVGVPNEDVLPALARELEISLDYLFGLTDDPTPRWKGTAGDEPTRAEAEGAAAVTEPAPSRWPDQITPQMRAVEELAAQMPPLPPKKSPDRGGRRG